MQVEHDEARAAFLDGLAGFLDVVCGLDDEQLVAASWCRGWTVGDVIVHVHLGLQEMLLGVVSPTTEPPDTDAASYWSAQSPPRPAGDHEIAQIRFVRLLGAAYRLPTGLIAHLRPTAAGLAQAVAALSPGALRFQGYVLTTGDFLATWAVELSVHQLDLRRELNLAAPAPAALRLARATVESLAKGPLPPSWPDDEAVLVGTGRLPLDDQRRRETGPRANLLPVLR